MVSLLYFFGVLTLTGRGAIGELAFGVPNLVIRRLYLDELRKRALPAPQDTDTVRHLGRGVLPIGRFAAAGGFHGKQILRGVQQP